jgi:hypothetical protein
VSIVALLAATAASAQTGSTSSSSGSPPAGQTDRPTSPGDQSPVLAVARLGPTREIKLAENTWFRFGAQFQAWYKVAQDRSTTPNVDGTYAQDFYCRRCRFFATGSVVKDIYFNILFEAGNFGKADPVTGAKSFAAPSILDAYGQVKFADAFWLSGGSILLPLTRNGTQPTTTYVSIDVANVSTSPILQLNTNVLRDLGIQANGFFLGNHLEYRLGVFQGSRQAAVPGVQSASHNAPRFVGMLSYNFWDTETGYVNGGHYYGSKKVLGVMGNFDYQVLRTDAPGFPAPGTAAIPPAGTSKNPYYGISGAVFLNYPLSGQGNPKGGDEIVGLLQFGYYDGGLRTTAAGATTDPGTYPNVLKQTNYLAEAGYYNHGSHFSVFGKFEKRKVSDDYIAALRAASNQTWIAGGVKYYVAPFNLMNFALQYERIINDDAPGGQQGGTNNLTFQMQTFLY